MSDKKRQEQIGDLKKLQEMNLPENVKKSISTKQKSLENNQQIRK